MDAKIEHQEIKWIRLAEIAQDLLKQMTGETLIVNIHLSTECPASVRAFIQRLDNDLVIIVNPLYNKGIESLILSIAHELTHVVLNHEEHEPENTKEFADKMHELDRLLKKMYKERG